MVSACAVSCSRSPIRRDDQQAEQRGQRHDPEAADLDQRQDHPLAEADQYVGVSTMISPVTHTAETAVNSAVTNAAEAPLSVATGSISSAVPTATATANPATTAAAGRRSNASSGERLLGITLGTPRRLVPRPGKVGVVTVSG